MPQLCQRVLLRCTKKCTVSRGSIHNWIRNNIRETEELVPSDRLFICMFYEIWDPALQLLKMKEVDACTRCTTWSHPTHKCNPIIPQPCNLKVGSGTRTEKQHASLDEVSNPGGILCRLYTTNVTCDREFTLLENQSIDIPNSN